MIIPALNEAPRLPHTVRGLAEALPGAPVVVVDSLSTDTTADVARSLGCEVVRAARRGYPEAVRLGWRVALQRGAEVALTLDADGQHAPTDAPRLIDGLVAADWVVGSRQGTCSPSSPARRAGNALLAQVVWAVAGGQLHDVTSGFSAMNARALALFSVGAGPADANLRVMALRAGLRVAEVPVDVAPRRGGQSMHDGLRGLQNLGASVRACLEAARP